MRINLSTLPVKMGAEPVCDFCGGDNPAVIYGAHRMSTGVEKRCWRWCACPACESLIDDNKFELIESRLRTKLIKLTPYRFSEEVVQYAIREVFLTFFQDAVEIREAS